MSPRKKLQFLLKRIFFEGRKIKKGQNFFLLRKLSKFTCLAILAHTCTKIIVFTPQHLRTVGVLFSPMVSGFASGRVVEVDTW